MNPSELPETVQCGDVLVAVQLCPFGEWPNGKTVQTCDGVAFNKLVENWRAAGGKEIICDFEHRFEDPSLTSDTSAAAWISNLAVNKERGLVGDLKFTDAGAQAVTSRRLRFLSPVWTLDADGRPDRLRSVALTNKPAIPVACVLNRAPQPVNQPVEETKENPMDKLKELLGLAADASDEDVVAAVTALQEQVAQANKEKEDAEAESFAEEHKAVCNKDALKKAYLLNKEAARELVAGLVPAAPAPEKKEEPPQTILNKETSATPVLKNKAREGLAACKSPAERVSYVMKHAAELAQN
jgi:phage I-like protein